MYQNRGIETGKDELRHTLAPELDELCATVCGIQADVHALRQEGGGVQVTGATKFDVAAAKLGEAIADGRKQADELSAVGTPEAQQRARLIRWHDENWIVAFREYLADHPDD